MPTTPNKVAHVQQQAMPETRNAAHPGTCKNPTAPQSSKSCSRCCYIGCICTLLAQPRHYLLFHADAASQIIRQVLSLGPLLLQSTHNARCLTMLHMLLGRRIMIVAKPQHTELIKPSVKSPSRHTSKSTTGPAHALVTGNSPPLSSHASRHSRPVPFSTNSHANCPLP